MIRDRQTEEGREELGLQTSRRAAKSGGQCPVPQSLPYKVQAFYSTVEEKTF
jgi:hypothetical protein